MGVVHNELRRVSGLLKGFQSAFGLAEDAGVERLGETITPVVNIWEHPEWAYLRREKLCTATFLQAAVAAEFGAVALVNPAGSGMLVILDDASSWSGTTGTRVLGIATEAVIAATLLTNDDVEFARDTRWPILTPPARQSVARVYRGSDLSPTLGDRSLARTTALANTQVPMGGTPLVLSPGFGAVVQFGTVNIEFRVDLRWRERAAVPDELR